MSSLIYLGSSGLLSYFIYWCYKNYYYPRFLGPLKDIPGPSNLLWLDIKIIYNTITGDPGYYLKDLHEKYGPIAHSGLGIISVIKPEETKKIYSGYKFQKHHQYKHFRESVDNIASFRDKKSHSLRKRLLAPAFNLKALLSMEPLIQKYLVTNMSLVIDHTINKGKNDVDLYDLYHKATLDVITEICFGKSSDSLNHPDFPVFKIPNSILKTIAFKFFLPFLGFLKAQHHPWINKTITQCLKERRDGYKRNDILQSLVDSLDPETGERLSDADIFEEIGILLLAGFETSSNILVWSTYFILKNPNIYHKLVDELLSHFPNKDQPINYNDCHKLPYLNAVLLETLRIRSSGGLILPRTVPEGGAVLCGYFIPEGTTVGTGSFPFHHSEEYWPKSESFIPERWLGADHEKLKSQLFTFSFGPRECIGKNLAWIQMYSTLANIIRKYDIQIDPNTELTLIQFLSIKAKEEQLLVKICRRPE